MKPPKPSTIEKRLQKKKGARKQNITLRVNPEVYERFKAYCKKKKLKVSVVFEEYMKAAIGDE